MSMNKAKLKLKFLLYTSGLLMAVWGLQGCGGDNQAQSSESNEQPIVVKVKKLQAAESGSVVVASGKLEAKNAATLSTRTMGYVTEVRVNVGDRVEKGQMLLSINDDDLIAKRTQVQAQIAEAEAAFKNAHKDYERFQNLFEMQSASQKELDDMRARSNMAQARLDAAKGMMSEVDAQFSYSNLRAPFAGVITAKLIKVGDMAGPGQPLLQMETPGNFQVIASVAESQVALIETGANVEVRVKSIDGMLEGVVLEKSISGQATGGRYVVKIGLDQKDAAVFSGMYANVRIPVKGVSMDESTPIISKEALVNRGQLTGVYTISQSGTAVLRWLRLGADMGDQVVVLSGISDGETYIVSAESRLYNGAKVTVN